MERVFHLGKRKFWSYENKLVTIFFFSIGFVFFDRLAINYLIPFIQEEFTLTNTQIGLIGSALGITWAISGPLGGFLSDRVNNKKMVLALFVVLFSVVSLMHGLVASFGMLLVFTIDYGMYLKVQLHRLPNPFWQLNLQRSVAASTWDLR